MADKNINNAGFKAASIARARLLKEGRVSQRNKKNTDTSIRFDEWYKDINNVKAALTDASKNGILAIESEIEHIAGKKVYTKSALRLAAKEITNNTPSLWIDIDAKGNPKQTSNNLKQLMAMYGI